MFNCPASTCWLIDCALAQMGESLGPTGEGGFRPFPNKLEGFHRPIPLLGRELLNPFPGWMLATAVSIGPGGEGSPCPLPLLGGGNHSALPLPILGGKAAMSGLLRLEEKGRTSLGGFKSQSESLLLTAICNLFK